MDKTIILKFDGMLFYGFHFIQKEKKNKASKYEIIKDLNPMVADFSMLIDIN